MTITTGPFDSRGQLPTSTLAIEASAGTGKTYALAELATRFLADGTVDSAAGLLMVTFTRAATGELRSRVRDRIVDAVEHLRRSSVDPSLPDPFLDWLASDAIEVPLHERLDNLERALGEFDSATITTIHGFASQMLAALGLGTGVDADVRFVDDTTERVLEVCSDVMSRAAVDPTTCAFLPTWERYVKRTRTALQSPDLVVVPEPGQPGATPEDAVMAELVRRAVVLLRRRRIESGTQTFDDLLTRLRTAIGTAGGTGALATVRRRFDVALIDEFQDTDPIQWEIFSTLFASSDSSSEAPSLVVVGDPKQAIYSFRGADVRTYVRAVDATTDVARRSLGVNWRSNGAMIEAVDTLFSGVTFGESIPFAKVEAAPAHREQRLTTRDGTVIAPLQIRCASHADLLGDDPSKPLSAGSARHAIAADLVDHTLDLLEDGLLPNDRPGQVDGATRPLRPSDIVVLVRSNDDAQRIRDALTDQGIPAVLARGSSVLESPAAEQVRWLLEAMVRPSDQRRARTFAVSWFGGHDLSWLDQADDAAIVAIQEQLHRWNGVVTAKGVVELLRTVWDETGVVERLLGRHDGDRDTTDLEHVGEILHLGAGAGPVSAAGLLAVLDAPALPQAAVLDTDADTDVASRRVETDAEAVQVMTVWVSKGLEFPIVLCPTMWSVSNSEIQYHDPATGSRTFDASRGGEWPDRAAADARRELADVEQADEQMRLLYVALTRARHHTALWWVRYRDGAKSALCRLLFDRDDTGAIDPDAFAGLTRAQPGHDQICPRLGPLARRSNGTIEVVEHGLPVQPGRHWIDPERIDVVSTLEVAVFDRSLDRRRSRWSFTAIKARDTAHGNPWDFSLDDEGADDEQRPPDAGIDEEPAPSLGGDGADVLTVSSLAWLPAGAAFGTLAHAVLEKVDFAAENLTDEVRDVVADETAWRGLSLKPVPAAGVDPTADGEPDDAEGARRLTAGLVEVIETPLGSMFGDRRLRDIPTVDCLDEMSFELPLNSAGGAASTVRDIGRLLVDRLDAVDPFRPWAAALADGTIRVQLEGHLTGSIDAVIRVRPPSGSSAPARYVVVDYKTNRLHDHGQSPWPDDYGATSMRASMFQHEYPLQALLYQVAVHRYLRWRLGDGYDPDTHLGGIAYLYLRGMTGADVRTIDGWPDGVCTWQVPGSVVEALSDLLDGERAEIDR